MHVGGERLERRWERTEVKCMAILNTNIRRPKEVLSEGGRFSDSHYRVTQLHLHFETVADGAVWLLTAAGLF